MAVRAGRGASQLDVDEQHIRACGVRLRARAQLRRDLATVRTHEHG